MKKSEQGLVCRLVVTSRAARFAVQQPVGTEADIELRLAQHAEFLAVAARFDLLTLCATDLACRFRGHTRSLSGKLREQNVTKVTQSRFQASGGKLQVWSDASPTPNSGRPA